MELPGAIGDGTVCRRRARLWPAERFLFIVTGRTLWSHSEPVKGHVLHIIMRLVAQWLVVPSIARDT